MTALIIIVIGVFCIAVLIARMRSYKKGTPTDCKGDCRHCRIECGGTYKRVRAMYRNEDIQQKKMQNGLAHFQSEKDAYLIDVRTPEEFSEGHIPKSNNIPLDHIDQVIGRVRDRRAPVYLYCQSGARAKEAEKEIRALGYETVHNIGGILYYQGPLEKK